LNPEKSGQVIEYRLTIFDLRSDLDRASLQRVRGITHDRARLQRVRNAVKNKKDDRDYFKPMA
jgi:hypothetical protein